ncbi:ATP-binding protein [Ideonella sp.]|uniref:sensor histidine kinase n=1 Tax=Ideonella sp. TaxID=1929293 RepID=UPI0035B17644
MPPLHCPRQRNPRRRGRGLTAALLLSAALAVALALTWQLAAPGALPAAASGWLAMGVFGAACAGAGIAFGHQRASARLRDARLRQHSAARLVDAWWWESDTGHRLRQWRPPAGASEADWAEGEPLGSAVWEAFGPEAPLKARLEALATIEPLRVRRRRDGQPWRLHAVAQFDGEGRFTGYVGTATPLAAGERGRFADALLQRLWPELDQPAIALRAEPAADGGTATWRVAALSPDAQRLLRQDGRAADSLSWDDLLARLPAGLAEAAASLAPGQAREAGDWTVSVVPVGDPDASDGGRLLLLRHRAPAAAPDVASAEEQASFAYSVSHDLRAPIRVVEGFARILKEDYGRFLDRIGNDHLERVLAAAARMNSMIDALLALSRLQQQPLSRKPVDLSQLATYIVEDLQRQQPERQSEVQIEPGLLVQGDPTLLRIALENLLGNAWKYSGQVPVAKIEFRQVDHQGRRAFVVADNGAGFDMRFADRLFGVFQRLHSAKDFQGTGVGLASVRRILRRHGGDIWAESEVGKGARFYFTLG